MGVNHVLAHAVQQQEQHDGSHLGNGAGQGCEARLEALPGLCADHMIDDYASGKVQQPDRWELIQHIIVEQGLARLGVGGISTGKLQHQQANHHGDLPGGREPSQRSHHDRRHQVQEKQVAHKPRHGVGAEVVRGIGNPRACQCQVGK